MKHNVVAPSVGESITEVSILKWAKQSGEEVKTGDLLLEIESDKATVEIVAENPGVLSISKNDGETVPIGEVIGVIDSDGKASGSTAAPPNNTTEKKDTPAPTNGNGAESKPSLSPSVRKIVQETGVNPNEISGSGKNGRITVDDVKKVASGATAAAPINAPTKSTPTPQTDSSVDQERPGDRRVPMSRIRKRIAERLVHAQHTAAILTTFNEVDMSAVMDIRKRYKDKFKEKFGVSLSFMSFFTKASVAALKEIPEVNAGIDGDDILYHDYCDIGIAVGSERGLVVPIIRNAETMTFLDIEKTIASYAEKARAGKLSIAEMTGGTFTISNGGTYGSLLSTPILNPPQSGILGMHKIQERPIVHDGKIEIRPMMYLALSYDHRIIDGKGAVTFLIHLKDHLENPEKLDLDFASQL